LFVGVGRRSNYQASQFLRSALVPEFADDIIGVELADWRMNIDGGFVFPTEDVLVCDTASILGAWRFDRQGSTRFNLWKMLAEWKVTSIDTPREESVYSQSCNCLCLGRRRVVYYDLCPRVADLMRCQDIEVFEVPGSELVKGRGGPRCLTRPLYLPADEMMIPEGLAR
jgi:arginine deiminase